MTVAWDRPYVQGHEPALAARDFGLTIGVPVELTVKEMLWSELMARLLQLPPLPTWGPHGDRRA